MGWFLKGFITAVNKNKLTGTFTEGTEIYINPSAHQPKNIFFRYKKEYEQFVMQCFCENQKIDIYIEGHEANLYNIVIIENGKRGKSLMFPERDYRPRREIDSLER